MEAAECKRIDTCLKVKEVANDISLPDSARPVFITDYCETCESKEVNG